MVIIVGGSGSGKTTLQKNLCEADKSLERGVTCTSRPKREGEVYGVDYYFEDEYVINYYEYYGRFIELTSYNGWFYGILKESVKPNSVFVCTPSGMRELKKYAESMEYDVTVIYLDIDPCTRLKRLLDRDGKGGMWESIRRIMTEMGQFDGVENEVDIVIREQKKG